MSSRTLVIGGAGFIGSHLVELLAAGGEAVTVFDDLSTGCIENLSAAHRLGNVQFIKGTVLDRSTLITAMRGCRRVYHLAVQCVRRSLGRPLENQEINDTGTIYALEAARLEGVERFIYCSSSEVYGNGATGTPLNEETRCTPVTVYGAAKLAGEFYALAYHQTYGLPTIVVRPFNTYGPRAHERGDLAEVIPRFFIRLLSGHPPIIFGSGENGRDFTYVTETARGIARAADCEALIGRVVNIARGESISINEVADAAARACGRPQLRPIYIEPRPGDVLSLQADTTLALRLLDFRAEIAFEQGLGQYLSWFRAYHNDPSMLLEPEPRNWQFPQ